LKSKRRNINLITDATYVHQKTMEAINKAVRDKKPFALGYQEGKEKGAMIFNPANLSAVHTDGNKFSYPSFENFADAVRLTLIAYPVFIDCEKMLPEENKPKIILLDK
jgi:hypothetical protein